MKIVLPLLSRKSLLEQRSKGFTLVEILIVMIILIVLMAFIMPLVINRMREARVQQAKMQLQTFDQALQIYVNERGAYPQGRPDVPRSGLAVLIGEPNPILQQQGMGGASGMPGTGDGMGMGGPGMPGDGMGMGGPGMPGDGMGMGGPGMPGDGMGMGAPGMPGAGDGMGMGVPDATRSVGSGFPGDGMGMGGSGMPGDGMGMGGPGMPSMPGDGMGDGMGGQMGAGMGGQMAGGQMGGGTTTFNAAQGAGASKNFLNMISLPKDPWGKDYFYEFPTQRRAKDNNVPAIWSAGPDGVSGNDDDVINWEEEIKEMEQADPKAYEAYMLKQKGMQSGTGVGGPTMPSAPDTMNPDGGMGGMGGMDGLMQQPPQGMGLETMQPQGMQQPSFNGGATPMPEPIQQPPGIGQPLPQN